MKKSISIWVFAAVTGVFAALIMNTSPLSRIGLTVKLPGGWQNAPVGSYHDSSCGSRRAEGIPFAFKRPNSTRTCHFDTNKLALLLNGATGIVLGLGYVAVSGNRSSHKNSNKG